METEVPFQVVNQMGGMGNATFRYYQYGAAACRPIYDPVRKISYVTHSSRTDPVTNKKVYNNLTTNAPAFLKKEDWLRVDETVMRVSRPRLRFFDDIYSANPYNVPDGMAKLAIQHTVMSDVGTATISMSPVRKAERFRQTIDTKMIPLPIIHADGQFDLRELLVSREGGYPLDITNIEVAARQVAEEVEKLSLGVTPSFSYGGAAIYGMTNYPQRQTKTMTLPTGSNAPTTVAEVLQMIAQLEAVRFYGPYVLYVSPSWGQYFDRDYAANYGGETLRTRMAKIGKISRVVDLDYLTGFQMLLVQLTPDVVQGVQAMPFRTIQWEEDAGNVICFRVMTMRIPRVRSDASGNTGYVHAVAA